MSAHTGLGRRPREVLTVLLVLAVLAAISGVLVRWTAADRGAATGASAAPRTPRDAQPTGWMSDTALQGFAQGTLGGQGGTLREVTTLADSGVGSLREALAAGGPSWIRFLVSGAIVLGQPLEVPSQTTIDGRGADVTLENKGLIIDGTSNIIVENLKFTAIHGSTSDALSVRNGAHDVWIDHDDFSNGSDGLVDITLGATDVTVSWCHFFNHDKTMLISALTSTAPMHVTVHHNWFDHTNQRNPLVRDAYAHVYDNYVDGFGSYGMQAQEGGYLLSQHNVLRAVLGSQETDGIRITDNKHGAGVVRAEDDLLLDGATQLVRLSGLLHPVPYRFVLEPAGPRLEAEITVGSGWRAFPGSTSSAPPLPIA